MRSALKPGAALLASVMVLCGAGNLPHVSGERVFGTYGVLNYENYGDYIEIDGLNEDVTEVVIPAEIDGLPVTSIYSVAFLDRTNLQSVTLPDTITHIGVNAFTGTPWLEGLLADNRYAVSNDILIAADKAQCTGEIAVPDGVRIVADYVFEGCEELISAELPDSVTTIGWGIFKDCTNLEEVTLSDGMTILSGATFYHCTSLNPVTIPDGVTEIDFNAFEGCTNLESVSIPEGVTVIGNSAFRGCEKLHSVSIPKSVTVMKDSVFYKSGLTDIYYAGTKAEWNAIEIRYPDSELKNALIHCNDGVIEPVETTTYDREYYTTTMETTTFLYCDSTPASTSTQVSTSTEAIGTTTGTSPENQAGNAGGSTTTTTATTTTITTTTASGSQGSPKTGSTGAGAFAALLGGCALAAVASVKRKQ